ncbi:MAG: ketoacyl-ACP synthase III [Acidobacteriota bacterium]
MARSVMSGMVMQGVVACLPLQEVFNNRDYPWFDAGEIRKITALAGIKSRRIVDSETCTSDLCQAAAERLLTALQWEPSSVDCLILVTQTADYVMPPSSCFLQDRLGLSESCATLDIALGCSAYVYGIWVAHSLLAAGGCKRVLLLAGDTPSKYVNPKDRTTALLFGDAGTATALESVPGTKVPPAHYLLMTDGKGWNHLIVPGGGFRERFPGERTKFCVSMDGAQVFDFTRNRVPTLIEDMLAFSQQTVTDYDSFVFHQANEYLIKFIASKSGIPMDRVPLHLDQYGNTSAASIPLTLALAGPRPRPDARYSRVMLLGFGVGLSWGACSMSIPESCLFERIEYRQRACSEETVSEA